MTILDAGDEELHYRDGWHKWESPDPQEQDDYAKRIADHMTAHRHAFGGLYLEDRAPFRATQALYPGGTAETKAR